MSRLFDNYVMVDWSAAAKPSLGVDSIWIGILRRDVRLQLRFEAQNPPTRHGALETISTLLTEFDKRGDRTLIGFDFPMGYPHGTAAALKLEGPAWQAMHLFLSKEIKDKTNNANNRFQVAARMNRLISNGPFPFWGCPPRDVLTTLDSKKTRPHEASDLPEHRLTEQLVKAASPVWKLFTAGSVGSQALVGIPIVQKLRDLREDARIWPFETGFKPLIREDLKDVRIVMAEIYPSMLKTQGKAGEVKDLAQVRAIGAHFAGLDEAGKLSACFGPAKSLTAAQITIVEQEEGWILGV
ncbi:cobalamin biosynthesis protein CbiG [Candidatus Phycosocius spiralis]|uniref:Molybdopterin-guanine dinucleotide biosynthesis protein A n=1 Tax=Candidatus Phycosocius spiralis TaxID=2815099 RepID=A0ABQ4PS55_9PROT|nr:cobalamin biosynthesis protein CbiG [Candidatus Phycosocius spiralis]GIU65847.1 molybdopterin-guanine dinucleotide biosynthesis protein A [Candidatus Phycosocius spiralis]